MRLLVTSIAFLALSAQVWASDPPPVPLTRPEMKQLLEESKTFAPRLKPPAPTPEELAAAKENGNAFGNSGNIRNLLPRELRRGAFFFWDGRTQQMDRIALRNPKAPATSPERLELVCERQCKPEPRADRPRSEHDAGLCLQDDAVLDRLARQ